MKFLEATPVRILQFISFVLFADLAQNFYHQSFV